MLAWQCTSTNNFTFTLFLCNFIEYVEEPILYEEDYILYEEESILYEEESIFMMFWSQVQPRGIPNIVVYFDL